MRANELMIGDWVYSAFTISELPCKITCLKNHEGEYTSIETTNVIGVTDIASLSPIPLTTEILEKNGFKPYIPENHLETVYACQDVSKAVADELYALWPYRDGSFYLLLRVDGKDMVRMGVHYIHQLQHALRLCGISKLIEL